MGNFKNICYSLAMRHQLHQCYRALNSVSLSGEEIDIGPGLSNYTSFRSCSGPLTFNIGKTVEVSSSVFWNSTSALPNTSFYRYVLTKYISSINIP